MNKTHLKYILAAAAVPATAVTAAPVQAQSVVERVERNVERNVDRAVDRTVNNIFRGMERRSREARRDRERQQRMLQRMVDRVENYTGRYVQDNRLSLRDYTPIRNCAIQVKLNFNGVSERGAVEMCARDLMYAGKITRHELKR